MSVDIWVALALAFFCSSGLSTPASPNGEGNSGSTSGLDHGPDRTRTTTMGANRFPEAEALSVLEDESNGYGGVPMEGGEDITSQEGGEDITSQEGGEDITSQEGGEDIFAWRRALESSAIGHSTLHCSNLSCTSGTPRHPNVLSVLLGDLFLSEPEIRDKLFRDFVLNDAIKRSARPTTSPAPAGATFRRTNFGKIRGRYAKGKRKVKKYVYLRGSGYAVLPEKPTRRVKRSTDTESCVDGELREDADCCSSCWKPLLNQTVTDALYPDAKGPRFVVHLDWLKPPLFQYIPVGRCRAKSDRKCSRCVQQYRTQYILVSDDNPSTSESLSVYFDSFYLRSYCKCIDHA